jgi:hypothetical protein
MNTHEFGDVQDTKVKSIKLALWYLEDPKRIELIDGRVGDREYINYLTELCDYLRYYGNTDYRNGHYGKVIPPPHHDNPHL